MKSCLILIIIFFFSINLSSAQCISGNCINGWGTYIWDTGDKYTGEWSNGNRTGLGVYDWINGSFYYGYFQDSKLEGDGFFIAPDSTHDQFGVFHNGVLYEKKDFSPPGCMIGNCSDGGGVYIWESNDIYVGEWRNGARTGYGCYDFDNGSWYIGYFTNGQLDGEGEYHPKDKDVMKGTFVNGEFQESTGNSSSSYKTSASSDSYSDRKINEADFCSVMKNVVADYTNNFENIKGMKNEDDEYSLGDSWNAAWKLSGSTEAQISAPLLTGHNTWYNVIYESVSYADARAKYDGYVSTMKNCGSNCCNLIYDTHDYKGDSYQSYLTYWLPLSVKEGYSDDYKNMEIEIELSQKIVDEGWEIVARVMELKD